MATLSDLEGRTTPDATATPDHTARPRRRTVGTSDSGRRRHSRSTNSDSCDERPPRRSSAFLEIGLGGDDAIVDSKLRRDSSSRPKLQVRFRSKVDVVEPEAIDWPITDNLPRPQMSPYFPTLPRLLFLAVAIILVVPSLHSSPLLTAEANSVGRKEAKREALPAIGTRDETQTSVCKRWAGQSAVVNGTLYYYGGRATTSSDQTSNEWSRL
jgi:hypothetical protein